MSANRLKCYLFDGLFLTFSLWLVLVMSYGLLHPFSEDQAVAVVPQALKITLVIIVFMALVSWILHLRKLRTLGSFLFLHRSSEHRPFYRTVYGAHFLLTMLLTFLLSLKITEFSISELTDPDGLGGALRLYNGLTHANLSLLPVAIVQVIETVLIAFLATVLALPIAFVLSFLSAKNLMRGPLAFTVYAVLRTLLNIARSVEPLIWALIFTVWVGVGPFAGMLALMIHSVAALAKQGSEVVEDATIGPMEAILSTGARPLQVIWFGVVPQVLMQFVALAIYRWDTNVRMATVIGLVGGGGIGTLLLKYQGQAMWPEVGCIILVIAIAVWLMDVASAYIREAIR
jgi:phosphonate transport system permease protein